MGYKVINTFKDKEDKGTLYKIGSEYPRDGYKPTKKRINELLKEHPKFKCAFIEGIEVMDESEE